MQIINAYRWLSFWTQAVSSKKRETEENYYGGMIIDLLSEQIYTGRDRKKKQKLNSLETFYHKKKYCI